VSQGTEFCAERFRDQDDQMSMSRPSRCAADPTKASLTAPSCQVVAGRDAGCWFRSRIGRVDVHRESFRSQTADEGPTASGINFPPRVIQAFDQPGLAIFGIEDNERRAE
jgi:hypothetical protein